MDCLTISPLFHKYEMNDYHKKLKKEINVSIKRKYFEMNDDPNCNIKIRKHINPFQRRKRNKT